LALRKQWELELFIRLRSRVQHRNRNRWNINWEIWDPNLLGRGIKS
jgi:hypothetical protein